MLFKKKKKSTSSLEILNAMLNSNFMKTVKIILVLAVKDKKYKTLQESFGNQKKIISQLYGKLFSKLSVDDKNPWMLKYLHIVI